MVRKLFENEEEVSLLNATDLILIPKVEMPDSVGHFRPISLCNFSYKVFSKLLPNRVKPLLRKIITEHQRAFVPGRMIQDNILIVHEAFHYLKNRSNVKPEFAVKLDMNKAYDRVEWDFLEAVLTKLNFHQGWIRNVMKCISSV